MGCGWRSRRRRIWVRQDDGLDGLTWYGVEGDQAVGIKGKGNTMGTKEEQGYGVPQTVSQK